VLVEEIRNIKSERRDLRSFGITFGIVLGLLGGALWWKGKDSYPVVAALSALFFASGLFVPGILRPLQKAWMTLAVILGWFMTRLILSILFYVIFTSIALISRIVGKKFLDLRRDSSKKSYWSMRSAKPFNKNGYEKQF
jgi:hypothetical protein